MPYRLNAFTGQLDLVIEANTGGEVTQIDADSGSATPSAGIINLNGDSSQGSSTAASGNTVTVTIADASTSQKGSIEISTNAETIDGTESSLAVVPSSLTAKLGSQTQYGVAIGNSTSGALNWTSAGLNGEIPIGSSGGNPQFASLDSSDNTIVFSKGANSLDLIVGSTVATSYSTDSGSAIPSSGVLTIAGGNGIATSGSGSTVSIAMSSPFTGDFTFSDSTAADTQTVTVSNSDNTAASASGASLQINVGGTTQIGDPYISVGTGSSIAYSIGTDTDDSQILKINTDTASSVTPSTGNEILILNSSSDMAMGTCSLGHAGEPIIDIDFTINGAALTAVLAIDAAGGTDLGGIIDHRHSDTAGFGAHWVGMRTRGTHDSSTIVQSGDNLTRILACGYDGTDYAQSAEIRAEVDGTPGDNDMPGRWVFLTSPDGSQTPTEAMRLDSSQVMTLANALAVSSGGTGIATTTAYGPICGGTTATGPFQNAGAGTSGQVLTSQGASALPTWTTSTTGTFTVNIQTFTSNGTYTPTSGMEYCLIEAVGGGGAGGGCGSGTNQLSVGGGGSSGSYGKLVASSSTIGASQSVTVGAGGTGTASSEGPNGATTSVGSLLSCNGGIGGGYQPPTTGFGFANSRGGANAGTGGDINIAGGSGTYGFGHLVSGYRSIGGTGGASFFGSGGYGGSGGSFSAVGNPGLAAGSGGGGAGGANNSGSFPAKAGGDGADGIVIITELIFS